MTFWIDATSALKPVGGEEALVEGVLLATAVRSDFWEPDSSELPFVHDATVRLSVSSKR